MKKTARRQINKILHATHYTLLDVISASPTSPMSETNRRHQLTRMWGGLAAIEAGDAPTDDDWGICSDAVNLLETLVTNGPWPDCRGDLVDVQDNSGLLSDAVAALFECGQRAKRGQGLRLSGKGMQALRAVLEDYAAALDSLPARTMVRCHIATQRRVQAILRGKKMPHDVVVMSL